MYGEHIYSWVYKRGAGQGSIAHGMSSPILSHVSSFEIVKWSIMQVTPYIVVIPDPDDPVSCLKQFKSHGCKTQISIKRCSESMDLRISHLEGLHKSIDSTINIANRCCNPYA